MGRVTVVKEDLRGSKGVNNVNKVPQNVNIMKILGMLTLLTTQN